MKNQYEIRGNVTAIFLRGGLEALIDTDDLPIAMSYKNTWVPNNRRGNGAYVEGRVMNKGEFEFFFLHRMITKCPKGLYVDHINRNPLDNRKINLRCVDNSTNLHNTGMFKHNTSGTKNLFYDNFTKRWRVEVIVHGKGIVKRYKRLEVAKIAVKLLRKKVECWN